MRGRQKSSKTRKPSTVRFFLYEAYRVSTIYPPYCSGGSRICEKGGPESKFPPGLKKSLSGVGGGGGGGDSDTFFPRNFLGRQFTLLGRGTVRLPDPTSGVASKKKKEKKKKREKTRKNSNRPKEGGAAADSAPPPWIRHCIGGH